MAATPMSQPMSQSMSSPAELHDESTGSLRRCSGALEFLRAVVQQTPMNASLKFETMQTLDWLRAVLDAREQQSLEYVFARCLMESCFAPSAESPNTFEVLRGRFESFDRRKQELMVSSAPVSLACNEPHLQRFALLRRSRVSILRAIHLAEAIDCDGPWQKSAEKDAMLELLAKVLTGAHR